MCGIVGYSGRGEAVPVLLEGLRRLEYRGYDSAGVAVVSPDGELHVWRSAGKLSNLVQLLGGRVVPGSVGIGHTRWATHGRPSDENAHPHVDCSRRICVVHNGIIENFLQLKGFLEQRGHIFRSETDTEVLAHLIEEELAALDGTLGSSLSASRLRLAVQSAVGRIRGTYAIAVISLDEPGVVVGARRNAPLVVGVGEDGNYLASDIPAILHCTRNVIRLHEGEVVAIDRQGVCIYDERGLSVERAPVHVEWDHRAAEKGGYPHFVIKEIHEQPEALRLALAGRVVDGRACLPELASLDPRRFQRVVFAACGTSYYACMVMKYAFEAWLRRPVETVIASEFRYARPVLDERVLFVAVSQSGETADTLAALHLAREMGATTVVVTNVVGSAMTHGADAVLYMQVGPEIGVVATKTFTGQLAVLYLLGLHLAERLGTLDDASLRRYCDELVALPGKVERALELKEQAARIASSCVNVDHLLFIGRGVGYPTALEGALKLKEISYIHAEGYPAGEMKHGPIALLEPNVPLLAVATKGVTYEKVLSNIQEARARDARVIAIATEGDEEIARFAEDVLFVPETEELLGPIVNVVPMQLLAYYAAVERGCDADQPRNLAKSVTVE